MTYCISRKGLPYGSTLKPSTFGSGGDGSGGKGGGVIYIETVRLQVFAFVSFPRYMNATVNATQWLHCATRKTVLDVILNTEIHHI